MDEKKEKVFEKKEELIEAAVNEFGERGYENASLNNILKEAGISKGTFYYHFKNKEDLYFYLISMFIEEKKSFFTNNIKPEDFNKSIFDLLKIMTEAGLKFASQSPNISRFSETFMKERDSEINRKMLERFSFKNNNYFESLIENAYSKGELRKDIPKSFVKHIITYLFTHLQDIVRIENIEDYEPAAYYLIEFMKNGLGEK
ncbi:transcriptional regulator, TetR family [Proteiniborus ethanoligenes]|uniref:Transcriptional regulator, TetR family n=1 Tax=Proteiniborus ethanoligenes TaxID=415015 RepID=A0A1H3MDT2_9FIRM|nr:TetR/AcrR family transcriptional regulator [Proteiniborus ethanoligenes]SDY74165.1 transcriptional regulator, TetR family [Proteiniborus ethanoligenes]